MWHGRALKDYVVVVGHAKATPAGFLGAVVADAMEFHKLIYKHHICVLLIKTN